MNYIDDNGMIVSCFACKEIWDPIGDVNPRHCPKCSADLREVTPGRMWQVDGGPKCSWLKPEPKPVPFEREKMKQTTYNVLSDRLDCSRQKYGKLKSHWEGIGVIDGEIYELKMAMHGRDLMRIYEEAADVANGCVRLMEYLEEAMQDVDD